MILIYFGKIFIVLILISLLNFSNLSGQSFNCSAFVINSDKIYLGKNFDWELGNGIIVFNPANELKKSCISGKKWRSKFSSITFNHFGKNMPLGGMNEAGLVIEELSTWPCEYPKRFEDKCVNEFEWIQYNLDKFSSVKKIIENIDKTGIKKFLFGLHFIAADKKGNSAIIEFINGKPKVYTGDSMPFKAITNNNYTELLKYQREAELRSDCTVNSQDRFLKIINLLNNLEMSARHSEMSILDSVKVKDTRWSILYDISNKNIYFTTDLVNNIDTVSFNDFSYNYKLSYYSEFYNNRSVQFEIFDEYKNNIYLWNLLESFKKLKNDDSDNICKKISYLINNKKN